MLQMKMGRFAFLSIFLFCVSVTVFAATSLDSSPVKERIHYFHKLIPPEHPRLMLVPSELASFRTFVKSNSVSGPYKDIFKKPLLEPANLPMPAEPPIPQGKGSENKRMWREGYQTAFNTAIKAQQYAFSYLLTGEVRYGREAARWLTHLAGWNVNGGINMKDNDEAFIQSLRPMLFAYDWAYGSLSADERDTIRQALKIRLQILFNRLDAKLSLTAPTPPDNSLSHPIRFVSTLGIGGLVLYDELPEAPSYLAWAYEYYLKQFPVWGGDDGGWSEGLAYWNTANNQHLLFLDAMKALNLTDIFTKTFFRNTGYFGLYNLEPYATASFGDLCNTIAPNANTALIIEKYALYYQDPYLMQYAQTIAKGYPKGLSYYEFSFFDTILHLYRKGSQSLKPAGLDELPRSRHFRDIGWVAMHSNLGNKEDDIMLGFKSSPYGSASHSHSDQNSFVVNAFGEALAISSGYREWYGSPHHDGWNRTTAAQNAVLFGVQGQPVRDPKATGSITRFYTGTNFDFATGDATVAYKNAGALKALRHIFFVNRQYFIILDDLESEEPTPFQWLLHAKEKMNLSPETGEISVHQGRANLNVKLIKPSPAFLQLSQTDQFTVPVDPGFKAKMPNEWHAAARTLKPEKSCNFLAVLVPHRENAGVIPVVDGLKTSEGYGVVIKNGSTLNTVLIAAGKNRKVDSEKGRLTGLAGSWVTMDGLIRNFCLIEGEKLDAGVFSVSASNPATIEGEILSDKALLKIKVKAKTEIRMPLPFIPKKIDGPAGETWSFDPQSHILTLELVKDAAIEIRS